MSEARLMGFERKTRDRRTTPGLSRETAVVDERSTMELPSADETAARVIALANQVGGAQGDTFLLSALMDSLPDNIYFKDARGRFLRVNHAMARYLGLTDPQSAVGRTDFDFFAPEHAEDALRDELEVMRTGRPVVSKDEREVWSDGQVRWVSTTKLPLRDPAGEIIGTFGISRDITARKLAEEQLYEQAFYCPLTRLPNRALFMDRLNHTVRRARRRGDYLFAVLFLDVDRFKGINDSLGHLAGDRLLVSVARRLERCVRPGDTVARLGGDEFTILLDSIRGPEDAAKVADRVHREMAAPFDLGGHEIFCTTSIGITLGSRDYEDAEAILRDADTAMYEAKSQGRARHEVFSSDMHEEVRTLLQVENDLRRAIDRGEFRLHYQPVVRAADGRVLGVEALVRWAHPTRGLVAPDEFIGVAEETGLISAIGLWTLEESCRQARVWQDRLAGAVAGQRLHLSANLSSRQFADPDLLDQIRQIIARTDADPRALTIEITESVLVENVARAEAVLTELREMGVRVCIDDFGMGHSSLGQIERFPVDALKIDRSFVARLAESPKTLAIVRSIVALAGSLGLDVTAEGVETEDQLARVIDLGCDKVQGFLFSRAVAPDELEALVTAQPLLRR